MKENCEEIQVFVVVPPRVLLLDVAGPIEVLRRANLEQEAVRFTVHYRSPSPDIMSSIGLPLSGVAPLPVEVPDNALIVLPGTADNVAFAADTPDESVRKQEAAIVAWLEKSVNATHTLVSICSGALLAARADCSMVTRVRRITQRAKSWRASRRKAKCSITDYSSWTGVVAPARGLPPAPISCCI